MSSYGRMQKIIMYGHIGQFWWRKRVAIVSEVSDSDTRERDNIPRHWTVITCITL